MDGLLWFIIGLTSGSFVTLLIMALFIAKGRDDE